MTKDEYKARFAEPKCLDSATKEQDTRAGRALAFALDIRKFEIELYWKRAAYFWAFIAAAFAAYALTYKISNGHEHWLSLMFSALGLVFSFAWYLVNRGSKFWQNNWERHVDLLEDLTIGPLYKVVAINPGKNVLTDAAQFSVTKINQMLSLFVTLFWGVLMIRSLGPVGLDRELDIFKFLTVALTILTIFVLWKYGRSTTKQASTKLHERMVRIEA